MEWADLDPGKQVTNETEKMYTPLHRTPIFLFIGHNPRSTI